MGLSRADSLDEFFDKLNAYWAAEEEVLRARHYARNATQPHDPVEIEG